MSDELQIEVQRELERHSNKIDQIEKELCNLKKLMYTVIAVSLGSPHIGAIGEVIRHLV
jgi:hypothetical protein